MYLYKTVIYKVPEEVVGLSPNEIIQHVEDKVDFETNFKALALETDAIMLAETTFIISRTYDSFKNLIDGTARTWDDVKYTEDDSRYTLNLLSVSSI